MATSYGATGDIRIGETVVGATPGSLLYIDANKNLAENNSKLYWDPAGITLTLFGAALGNGVTVGTYTRLAINGGIDFNALTEGPAFNDAAHIGGFALRSTTEAALDYGFVFRSPGGYLFEDVPGEAITWRFLISSNGNSNFGMASSAVKVPLSKLEVTGNLLIGPETWTGVNTAPANGLLVYGKFALGTASTGFAAQAQITKDGTADTEAQLFITGATNENRRLEVGYNSTGNYGIIQANESGTAVRDLRLQAAGGNVAIGAIAPTQSLHIYRASPFILLESTTTGANGIQWKLNGTLRWVAGNLASDADLTFADGSGNKSLILGAANKIGFLGAAAVVRQTRGATFTNNITAGGANDSPANWTDLTLYANDAAAIRNFCYQTARVLNQYDVALRALGLLT